MRKKFLFQTGRAEKDFVETEELLQVQAKYFSQSCQIAKRIVWRQITCLKPVAEWKENGR